MPVKSDKFSNIAYLSVTESALNTLTFARLDIATGALLGEKKFGMIIHRASYGISPASWAYFNGTVDFLTYALTVSNNLSTLGDSMPEVVDSGSLMRIDLGVAASGGFHHGPIVHDFSELPGGGLIVPVDRLYLAAVGSGLSAASSVAARLYYTMLELSQADYWDLVEARRIIST